MSRSTAFTLVELLITIAIIAILTGIAAISYTGVRQRGRDAERKNDLAQLKIVLSTYYNAQVPAQYVQSSSSNPPAKISINDSTDALTVALKPNYIKDVPVDPIAGTANPYKYQSFVNGGYQTDFKLYATLENTSDTKGWVNGAWAVDGYVLQNE